MFKKFLILIFSSAKLFQQQLHRLIHLRRLLKNAAQVVTQNLLFLLIRIRKAGVIGRKQSTV